MTAKQFVKSKYPNARCESHKVNGPCGERYYLIRDGREFMYMAEGATESKAWVNAKNSILAREKTKVSS
jgi:hypothetical protein